MNNILNLSSGQLKRALAVKEQIEALEAKLKEILLGESPLTTSATAAAPALISTAGKRTVSPVARARMAAAQRARWANNSSSKPSSVKQQPKRPMSAAAKARLAALAKARWAKARASGRNAL